MRKTFTKNELHSKGRLQASAANNRHGINLFQFPFLRTSDFFFHFSDRFRMKEALSTFPRLDLLRVIKYFFVSVAEAK
jgi:hypothetical protein